jgi:hypothetical protein
MCGESVTQDAIASYGTPNASTRVNPVPLPCRDPVPAAYETNGPRSLFVAEGPALPSSLLAIRARGMTVHESAVSAKVTGMFRLSSAVMVDE